MNPLIHTVTWVRDAPTGPLAMLGSFVLLGAGTLLALTKHRWLNSESNPAQENEPTGP
jgi:hypothetical protein